ncbi:MAG: uracil-DNA glycosylase family protein [Gammaproteobacteria bacterium]|nr:uracil-DNA glycosylase family protein [Gammaproteobacteria bacterium]
MPAAPLSDLITQVRQCRQCADLLPHEPRPVLQAESSARILIAGQAPGTRVHQTGIPWNDPSGERLRRWMAVPPDIFYDPRRIAIIPAGFCYPGKGPSGDLPPRPECAELWLQPLLANLPEIQLTLLIGQYAHKLHLGSRRGNSVAETVRNGATYAPNYLPLPHPSPRNRLWLRRNPWFDREVVPQLQQRCALVLGSLQQD